MGGNVRDFHKGSDHAYKVGSTDSSDTTDPEDHTECDTDSKEFLHCPFCGVKGPRSSDNYCPECGEQVAGTFSGNNDD